jgi:hypothetical protein
MYGPQLRKNRDRKLCIHLVMLILQDEHMMAGNNWGGSRMLDLRRRDFIALLGGGEATERAGAGAASSGCL